MVRAVRSVVALYRAGVIRRTTLAILGALVLTVAACGSAAVESTTPAGAEDPTTSSGAPIGSSVALVGGGQFDLGSIEGTDTVLWFWAPW